jgi:4-amino-4-deoxy-L-arabinose transferase-like glycosyltransferase
MIELAGIVFLLCLGTALLSRRLRPTGTLPLTITIGAVVILAAAISTGGLVSSLIALTVLLLAWLLGETILIHAPLGERKTLVRVPLAIASGLMVQGLLLFGLGAVGQLNAPLVLGAGAVLFVASLVLRRERLSRAPSRLRRWRPEAPSWFETVIIGLSVGFVTYALLAVFVPELHADAMQDHLPIAREVWQSGKVSYVQAITTSRDPIQAHLFYAVVYGFGGMTAAKLLHAAIGLVTVASIAAIGSLLSSRTAATVGAAIFVTTPLVLWEMGHVYPDLFPVLYIAAAILCLLLWQRDGTWIWLVGAGLMTGFGFTTKKTLGIVAVCLVAAIFLVGRQSWRWRERIVTTVLFGFCAVVVVTPWLVRGVILGGRALPDLPTLFAYGVAALGLSVAGDPGLGAQVGRASGAIGEHGLLALLQSPWRMALHEEPFRSHYAVIRGSDIGVAFLILIPLAMGALRSRAMALLVVTSAFSYVTWWLLPVSYQNTRHLLPVLAIMAPLAGAGVAAAMARAGRDSGPHRASAIMTPLGVSVGLLIVPFLFATDVSTRVPVDFLLGQESASDVVEREVSAVAALKGTQLLPPDTPVSYVGRWPGAQIYTEARLVHLIAPDLFAPTSAPEQILATLKQLGVDYFIWDRAATPASGWRAPLLSTDFLRRHTRILAGDEDGYLFARLPTADLTWGVSRAPNKVSDSKLNKVGEPSSPWTTSRKGVASDGVVQLNSGSSMRQKVAVVGGHAYVLAAVGQCANSVQRLELALHWFDKQGTALGVDRDSVIPGEAESQQFLWRRAPQTATRARIEVAARAPATCQLERVTLRELP